MDALNIAFVGNPNVGKSTLFNALTGLRQHTGNWPGKTVDVAVGHYQYGGREYRLTDLPGLYSLCARSEEERLAADYIQDGKVDCAVVVCDATCLAKSLILALQVTQCAEKMVLCLNLCDEARGRGIAIDAQLLSQMLQVPVVETAAGKREGLEKLRQVLRDVCDGFLPAVPKSLATGEGEKGAVLLARQAGELAAKVQKQDRPEGPWREHLDGLLLHRAVGYPAAFVLLMLVLWLTIWGANYPSELLERLFFRLGVWLSELCSILPTGVKSFLLDGVYDTLARVVTVMLPPMAIFFPLFTLLEDLGILPRLAFLLDRPFERCGACGKQALTSCMSLGCNAVGVTGCRIIDSPRERLVAILTCSFLPCNGRFPTMILLIRILFPGSTLLSALLIALCLVAAMAAVLGTSWLLNRTLLRGKPSGFVLELPPYRLPRVGEVLVRSVLDRTLFVLGRAVVVAAPAGALIWICNHVVVAGSSLLMWCAQLLEPLGSFLGMSGPILLAFVLGFPANELVIPVLVMLLTGAQTLGGMAMPELGGINAVCMLIFCLFHWPCGTTVLTVHRETGSLRWTLYSILLPTAVGMFLCAVVHLIGTI